MHGRTPSRFTPAQAGRRQPERARPGSLEHRPLHGVEAHHVEPTGRVRPRDARTHADAADHRDDPPVATGERLQQVAFTRMLPPGDRVLLLGDAGRWIVAVVFRPAPTAADGASALRQRVAPVARLVRAGRAVLEGRARGAPSTTSSRPPDLLQGGRLRVARESTTRHPVRRAGSGGPRDSLRAWRSTPTPPAVEAAERPAVGSGGCSEEEGLGRGCRRRGPEGGALPEAWTLRACWQPGSVASAAGRADLRTRPAGRGARAPPEPVNLRRQAGRPPSVNAGRFDPRMPPASREPRAAGRRGGMAGQVCGLRRLRPRRPMPRWPRTGGRGLWSRTAVSGRRGGAAASRRGGSTAAVPDDQSPRARSRSSGRDCGGLAGCPQLRTVTAAGPRGGPVAGHADAGLGYPA